MVSTRVKKRTFKSKKRTFSGNRWTKLKEDATATASAHHAVTTDDVQPQPEASSSTPMEKGEASHPKIEEIHTETPTQRDG